MTGPHADVEPDRLVETHSAYVLMVGDRVLKWKKALDLGFADFRSLEARKRACRAEVDLNRRLAPDVYLGVDVLRREDGSVREHVVVMRRLPASTRLSALVTTGSDVRGPLHQLARMLADFHSRCAPSPHPEDVGGPARLRELWDIGFDALDAAGDAVDNGAVAEARDLVHAYLHGRAPLLHERIRRGLVRDGHGDLLADDIFCLPDGPQVLDCLDFDPGFRHGDVLCDVATLAMDLERLGATEAAAQLLREYEEFSAEHHPPSLAHLYIAYRAQVRAKVALIRAAQTSDPVVCDHELRQARQLVELMVEHLRLTRAVLVLVGGLPGSGKSTVAEGLSGRAGSLVLSSDLVRRELQIPVQERYTAAARDQVYQVVLHRAGAALAQGWDVVLDATWTSADHREAARELADQTGSTLLELRCDAADDVAQRRLARRPAGHPSDAGADVRRVLASDAAPWPGAVTIDTGGTAADAVTTALTAWHRVLERPHPLPNALA